VGLGLHLYGNGVVHVHPVFFQRQHERCSAHVKEKGVETCTNNKNKAVEKCKLYLKQNPLMKNTQNSREAWKCTGR